jgi:hypothetical protein
MSFSSFFPPSLHLFSGFYCSTATLSMSLSLCSRYIIPAGSKLTCSGAWKDASFKNYNFAAAGQLPEGGALHPLLKMREEMRQIFFDMGYVSLLYDSYTSSHGIPSIFYKKVETEDRPLKKIERKGKKWRMTGISTSAHLQIY